MSGKPAPIRARRGPRGTYLVTFAEAPRRSFSTPIPNDEYSPGRAGPGRMEAIRWARRNRERLLAGAPSALALREFCRDFFDPSSPWVTRAQAKGHTFSAAYLAMRQGHLDNYIIPLFGDLDPRELSGRYIDDALLAATRKGGQALAPATKYKIVYSLNLLLADLVERKIIAENPLTGIRAYSKAPVAPRGAIPREYQARLFPAAHGDLVRVWGSAMWATMMLCLSDTGMRPIETGRLRWGDLYRERLADGRELWSFVFQGAKRGKMRAVGLSLRTVQELLIWRSQSHFSGDEDLIFTASGAAPLTDAGILKAFRRGVVNAVGLAGKGWVVYSLRHTFVTRAMGALPEAMVSLLAGHSVQVDRIYQHPGVEEALAQSREARIKMDEARG